MFLHDDKNFLHDSKNKQFRGQQSQKELETTTHSTSTTKPEPYSFLTKLLILLIPILLYAGYETYHVVKGATFFNKTLSTNVDLENGLVGHWTFDGPDMTTATATDISGNGNNGTLTNNPKKVTGKIGQGLSFDGSDDRVVIIDNATLNVTATSTFAAWVYIRSWPAAGTQYIASLFTDEAAGATAIWRIGSQGLLTYQKRIGINFHDGTDHDTQNNTDLTLNRWTHIVVTTDGTNARFYINGVLDTTQAYTITPTQKALNWNLGGQTTNNRYLNGVLDDVRIYNRALSALEVTALYNMGEGTHVNTTIDTPNDPLENGLVGHWTFDGPDMTTATATDISGNGNNGTLTNNPKKVTGKIGQGLSFDGSDDYVSIGNKSIIDGATAASICFWLKYSPTSVTIDSAIVSKWNSGAGGGWLFWVDDIAAIGGNTNTISFTIDSAQPGLVARVEGASNLVTSGMWDYYCGTFQGGSHVRLYKNGVLNAENTTSIVGAVVSTTNAIYIANSADGSLVKYTNASIDDVRIYNRALSAQEVAELYARGGGSTVEICRESSVQDADANTYNTLAIGSQCWLDRNMNVGTRINGATNQTDNHTTEKWCYGDTLSNCTDNHPNKPDGGLYQWDEAMQYSTTEGARGICPVGFHIPSDAEWHTLEKFLTDGGGSCGEGRSGDECSPAGTKLKPGGKSQFEANLTGNRSGGFAWRGSFGYFWSSSKVASNVRYRYFANTATFGRESMTVSTEGLPIRCIQD